MRILIIERNLLWSTRLANAAKALGHAPLVVEYLPETIQADVAIVNLSDPQVPASELQAAGVKVIAHAGHKETEKLQIGQEAGCDLVVTNSELTHKLGAVLARVAGS